MVAVSASVFGAAGKAGAVGIPTGNENVEVRWDNTLRYTLGVRVKGQNDAILKDANADDGDRNFARGIVANRLDLLSEFDASYKKTYGIRVSGAAWYDQRYNSGLDNTSVGSSNHLVNGQQALGLSSYTDRYYGGPSGELLDAFAFGTFTLGEIPFNLKVGRHTVIWGESMFASGGAQGISYSQSGIDAGKGFALPGVEMKEIFRPLNQVSLQVQPTKEITLGAQYFLQWEATRLPGAGSYLSFADLLGKGGESLVTPPPPIAMGVVRNAGDIDPRQAKDWGLMARWSPAWLEGTLGVYYRNFTAKDGQLNISPISGTYDFGYASDVNLYGVSVSQQYFGISVGAEMNYRTGMPLQSEAAIIGPFPGATSSRLPGAGETFGTRGDTFHAVVNTLKLFTKSPVFDNAAFLTEFVYDRWLSISSGRELFKGRDGYAGVDRVTKDHVAAQFIFNPTWFQVLPGVDLSMPLSCSVGLAGTSSIIPEANNKNDGQYGIGFSADIFQKYKADLNYVGYFGPLPSDAAGTHADSPFPTLKDRNMITLTLKTTF